MFVRWSRHGLLLLLALPCARAQSTDSLEPPSVSEKWDFFVSETATPLMLVSVVPDALLSQLTRSAPLYGKHFGRRDAFAKRFAATLGDDVSQNFFPTSCSRRRFMRTRGMFEKARRTTCGGASDMLSAAR